MSSPTRTTFEVKVVNKLKRKSIWIKIAAELNYATQIQSSLQQQNSQKKYNKSAYRKSDANSRYNKTNRESSDYTNNKTHNKSTYGSSTKQSSSNSSQTNVNAKASYGVFSANVDVGHKKSNQQQSSSTSYGKTDNLQHNISKIDRKALDENATTDYNSDSDLKEELKQNINSNQASASSVLTNKIIDPGFVRLTAFQSLSIPVIVENESQVVYITVYFIDDQCERIVIANQVQINRQLVEIRRNKITNDIELSTESESNGQFTQFRNLLISWGIPDYLCDAMKNCGWHNPKYWNDITERHLIEMGFKAGHRIIFNNEYIKYKMKKDIIKNQLNYKNLLKEWNIPIHLFDNMKENGWDDLYLWHEIDEDDLKEMQFKKGHIKKFKKYVNQNNDHIKQFEGLIKKIKENKTVMDEYDEDDNDNKYDYNTPNIPSFSVKQDEITNNSVEIELKSIKKTESYLVEIDEDNNYEWKRIAEIRQRKCHKIKGLKTNTNYSIRIRAQNAFKKSEYSKVMKLKTKDKEWMEQNSQKIPSFDYHVANNDNNVWISFKPKELQKINESTKYNEVYHLQIALSNNNKDDDEKVKDALNWASIGKLDKNTSSYQYNINHLHNDGKMKMINVRITSINDLSCSQYSSTKTFKINQISETQVIHTKNNRSYMFKINANKTMVTRTAPWETSSNLYSNYRYSTFAVGVPITNYVCNKYDICFKKNKTQYFGYCISNDGKMANWGGPPGDVENKKASYGLCVGYDNSFMYYGPNHRGSKQTYHDCPHYTIPSQAIVILSFDFINDELKLYCNDKNNLLKTMSLDGHKIITPLFSVCGKDQTVELLKCKFYA